MRKHGIRRGRLPLVLLVVAGLATLGVTNAAAGPGAKPVNDTIKMKLHHGKPRFVADSNSIDSGGTLQLINKTDPQQIGPHTFSLVTESARPSTHHQLKTCFHKNHICRIVAKKWHHINLHTGNVGTDPSEVGNTGWDTEGNKTNIGDSKVFDDGRGESYSQVVSAAPGTTLHFMCVVHPEMQGVLHIH